MFSDPEWQAVDLPHDWSIEGLFSKEHASRNLRLLLRLMSKYANKKVICRVTGNPPDRYIAFVAPGLDR